MQKLFLIDAYALIFRYYYALIRRPMRNAEGDNISAVFGTIKFINDLIEREKPHYLGVAFDPKGGSFRKDLYADYKANRAATPEDIQLSVPIIKEILQAMHIPILEVAGYEADDVIGTLSHKASLTGEFETYMVTPDKDFGQLIGPRVFMYRPTSDGYEIVRSENLCEYYGITDPKQIIDILAIWGDASDNIPGIPGIGEKGASALVGKWGDIEHIFENIDKLTPRQAESLSEHREQLKLARQLATISLDVPIEFDPERLIVEEPNLDALRSIYLQHGFRMFLRDLDSREFHQNATQQTDLFGNPVEVSENPPTKGKKLYSQMTKEAAENSEILLPEEAKEYKTIETVKHNYITVKGEKQLSELVDYLKRQRQISLDTETNSLDPLTAKLVGISIAVEPHEAYWIPAEAGAAEMLREVLESPTIDKIGQNLKFDIQILKQTVGIQLQGNLYDTMVEHYLLRSEDRHSMDYMARTYLSYSPVSYEDVVGKGAKQLTMDLIDPEIVARYAAEDADITLQLHQKLWAEIEKEEMTELYSRFEAPLISCLATTEMKGVKLDLEVLKALAKELNGQLTAVEEKIQQLAGVKGLNINSPKQLGEVLFDHLKIVDNPKRTRTKQYRTDEETLLSIADKHPIVNKILEYRGLKKLLSTYIEALPKLVSPKSGRVHTSFNQTVTATGRLSSTNPNLQNIPIRDDVGREIRRAFIAEQGNVLISADYSQIELRIMAHLSRDSAMMEAFLNGEDIHSATAAKIYSVETSEVNAEQRRRAKTANFGIIYGISVFGLSQRLDIPRGEAKELIDGYFALYPEVHGYMEQVKEQARADGYVSTIFGRRRYLPDINSPNAVVRSFAERNAINAPIQGSAADIIKLAMIQVAEALKEYDASIVLQVHDELVVECRKEQAEEVRGIIVKTMSECVKLDVPMEVDALIGNNWMDMK